jgi:hypothetical protein
VAFSIAMRCELEDRSFIIARLSSFCPVCLVGGCLLNDLEWSFPRSFSCAIGGGPPKARDISCSLLAGDDSVLQNPSVLIPVPIMISPRSWVKLSESSPIGTGHVIRWPRIDLDTSESPCVVVLSGRSRSLILCLGNSVDSVRTMLLP